MKLNKYLKDKVKSLGVDITNCKDRGDLAKLLPANYYFCEQRLWCGDTYVDADNYDYPNAILEMLIKLNTQIAKKEA